MAAASVGLAAFRPLAGQAVDSRSDRPAAGPTKKTRTAPKESRSKWKAEVETRTSFQYDHNVFLLSPGQREALASPSPEVAVSGRYADMESAGDMLAVGRIGFHLSAPGAGGRTLEITPAITYELASRNQLRREAAGALSIAQALGRGRRLRLKAEATPRHFSRNYLSDAIDADADGSITPSERVYQRGEYGDYSIGGDLRLPLRGKGKRSLGLLTAGAGFYSRSYDAPLAVRDLRGPTVYLAAGFGEKSAVGFEVDYELASLSATQGSQVLLLDEPSYDADFNGNGNTSDIDARAVVDIDRSRLEHKVGAALTFDAGRRSSVSLGYDYRLRSFRSKLPYDETNAGRNDSRNSVRGSVRTRLRKGVSALAAAKFLTQSTNRGLGAALGDEADYRNFVVSAGLQASF